MGIDYANALMLGRAAAHARPSDGSLMLGRQEVFMNKRHRRHLAAVFDGSAALDVTQDDLFRGFAEPLCEVLGFPGIQSMDVTDYEGCDIQHDLNQPLPVSLHKEFGFVFDGGTLEHVFNISQALENVHNLLKPGGVFLSMTPGDGWFGHGFWQSSPELVFSYWGETRGYTIIECLELPDDPNFAAHAIPDPRKTQRRSKRMTHAPRVYLAYIVRRPETDHDIGTPQQSDYLRAWNALEV